MTIEESKNVQKRIFKYCTAHSDLARSGIIKGMDPDNGKLVLQKNGIEKRVSIDILENNLFDFDKFEEIKDEKIETLDSINSLDEMIEEPFELLNIMDSTDKIPRNLEELKSSIASKNENLINNALETFAIDSTGKININKAIKVVTDNSADNVIDCVKNNKKLPIDLKSYDITGKCIVDKENSENVEINNLIDSSFNNILLYVEAAKLKNINFNDVQIANAKTKYETQVNDKINILGLNKQKDENRIIDFEQKKQESEMKLQLKPDTNIKKAGFADIIILTIIVLIYAAIIINLIMKLK